MSKRTSRLGRRGVALVGALALVVLGAGGVRAGSDGTALAAAEASAVHVQATRESLLPIPNMLDSFIPYIKTQTRSPDTRLALASPVYDNTISNLPGLMCFQGVAEACSVSYPLQAVAPGPAGEPDSQTLVPAMPAGPLEIGAGYASAHADADGTLGRTALGSLTIAMPSDAGASRSASTRSPSASGDAVRAESRDGPLVAARILASALRRVAPGWKASADSTGILVRVGGMSSWGGSSIAKGKATATAVADLSDVEILEGLVRVRVVHSEVSLAGGRSPSSSGYATLQGVTVGPFDASVVGNALTVPGQEALSQALAAMSDFVRIGVGGFEAKPREGGYDAVATALTVSYRQEIITNTGADAVELVFGLARATAARSETSEVSEPPASAIAPPVSGTGLGEFTGPQAPVGESISGSAGSTAPVSVLDQQLASVRAASPPVLPHLPFGVALAALCVGAAVLLLLSWLAVTQVVLA
ncbi:MAG: hypothetical protein WDA71_07820 [Actinomycetota bacterium]